MHHHMQTISEFTSKHIPQGDQINENDATFPQLQNQTSNICSSTLERHIIVKSAGNNSPK